MSEYLNPYLQPPVKKRKSPIGYVDPYVGTDDEAEAGAEMPLWQRNELLNKVASTSSTAAQGLLGALSVPGSLLNDVLADKKLGSGSTGGDVLDRLHLRPDEETLGGWARPVADFAFEAATDPLNLATFGGGAVGKAAAAAKAANIFDDVSRVASRAAIPKLKAAQAAGEALPKFADDALESFSRNFTGSGANSRKSIDDLTDDDLFARPLVGRREAAKTTSLEQLVQSQADPAKAIEDIDNYLKINHGTDYNAVKTNMLGHDIGLRMPTSDVSFFTANLPGGEAVSKALDRAGQSIRWSGPGRHAHAAFSNQVLGTTDEGDQILAKQLSKADREAMERARRKTRDMTADLPEEAYMGEIDFAGTKINGSQAVRNVIEGTANAAERNFVSSNPRLQQFVDRWGVEAKDYLKRSRTAGIGSSSLVDEFGISYFPRSVDDLSFDKTGGHVKVTGGKTYSVMTGDQLKRADAMKVPGGTKTLQELSLDDMVAGPNRRAMNDGEAADYIKQRMDAQITAFNRQRAADAIAENQRRAAAGQHQLEMPRPVEMYNQKKAEKLARTLNQIKPEAISSKYPIFGQHFTEDLSRYVAGREKAIGRSKVLYDTLGSTAQHTLTPDYESYLQGGFHGPFAPGSKGQPLREYTGAVGLNSAFRQLGLKSTPVYDNLVAAAKNGKKGMVPTSISGYEGAKDQILQRLQGRFPEVDLAELKNVAIDRQLMNRLNRIADFYHEPEVHSKALQFLDNVTKMWKGSILAWPARFTRDWLSGMFSNIVEVGQVGTLQMGYASTKRLLQGQYQELDGFVSQMPLYSKLPTLDARRDAYLNDLAATGLQTGRRITDVGQETASRASGLGLRGELNPGSQPVTTLGYQVGDLMTGRKPLGREAAAYSELGNTANWQTTGRKAMTPLESLKDGDVTHPILRWSSKLGDTTDSINRIAGYNALLLQGISPREAAARIMRAQVDYSSLTKVERGFFRRLIPFWSYNSRIGKYVVEQVWNNPGGRYSQLGLRLPQKLSEGSSDPNAPYVPDSIKRSYGIGLETMRGLPVVGRAIDTIAPRKEGVSSWLSDVDIPGIDLINTIGLKTDLNGNPKLLDTAYSTVQNASGQLLHPWLKAGLEGMTGKDFFTGREKRMSENALQAIGRRAGLFSEYSTADQAMMYADPLLQQVPFLPRVTQLVRRALDTDKIPDTRARLGQMVFNGFTGTKIQNISDEIARFDAMRQIEGSLSDNPLLRTFEQKYIPKEAMEYADPESLTLYQLQRQLNKENRQVRKAKLEPQQVAYNPMNY